MRFHHAVFSFRFIIVWHSFRIRPISCSYCQYGGERCFKPIGCSARETSHDRCAGTTDCRIRKPRAAVRLAARRSGAQRTVGRRQRRTRWLAGQVRAFSVRAQPSLSTGHSASSRYQNPFVHVAASCAKDTPRIHPLEWTVYCFDVRSANTWWNRNNWIITIRTE